MRGVGFQFGCSQFFIDVRRYSRSYVTSWVVDASYMQNKLDKRDTDLEKKNRKPQSMYLKGEQQHSERCHYRQEMENDR